MEKPIETPSAQFSTGDDYAITVYIKPAIWMYIMELSVGKEAFDKSMRAFFNEWKFKHPYPEDLKGSLERSIGNQLNNMFKLLLKEGSFN
jgi:aminopeptidase N